MESLCSSRDGVAFTSGVVRLVSGGRMHMVLNSLSRDFIAASFALLGEGCAFQEIGKRDIWAAARHAASSSSGPPAWLLELMRSPSVLVRASAVLAAREGR